MASYTYNAQSQRTQKETADGITVYHYDVSGNLILETTGAGVPLTATLWAETLPVAQIAITPGGDVITYLHTDHLNTPRVGTDANGAVVWRWEGEAFGATFADEDPDGDGTLTTVNLRFSGQYYDVETGLHYNWNRYYDPRIGRYITSDPVGIDGGLNTYTYAQNNPVRFFDATGKEPTSPNNGSAGSSACSYYDEVCGRTGCTYYCRLAPKICRNPKISPTFLGIPDDKIRCIRKCLIEEDKQAWNNNNNIDQCDGCMDLDVIDQYHCSCFSECGVSAWRYPGVGSAFPCLRQ